MHRHIKAPIGAFSCPDAHFSHKHINLVGPLSPSRGQRYLFTCADRFTRWCEAIPLAASHAETVILAFVQNWIAQFGVPKSVTADLRSQFESTLFFKLCGFLCCECIRTTAYHPAANGMVERQHCQLKAALVSHADREHWVDNLPIVLLGIRSTFKPDINACVAELVYESTLRLLGEFLEYTTPPTPGNVEDFENSSAANDLSPHASPTHQRILTLS